MEDLPLHTYTWAISCVETENIKTAATRHGFNKWILHQALLGGRNFSITQMLELQLEDLMDSLDE